MSLTENKPKPAVKRTTGKVEAITAPTLVIGQTNNYEHLYNTKGMRADTDLSIYRPVPPPGYFIIGDYVQANYDSPTGVSEVVMALNDDPANPMLKSPTTYRFIWDDRGSRAILDGSVWYPVPPAGYVSVGFVAHSSCQMPDIPAYRCVRADLVHQVDVGNLIWSDINSGGDMDISIYAERNTTNCFVAKGNYGPYSDVVYDLNTE